MSELSTLLRLSRHSTATYLPGNSSSICPSLYQTRISDPSPATISTTDYTNTYLQNGTSQRRAPSVSDGGCKLPSSLTPACRTVTVTDLPLAPYQVSSRQPVRRLRSEAADWCKVNRASQQRLLQGLTIPRYASFLRRTICLQG